MSHTPGPWDIKHLVDNRAVVTHKYDNGEHDTIAWVTWSFSIKTFDEVKANAALIARAPDMAAEITRLRADNAKLREALENIRDEARTGVAPEAFGMTPRQWDQHKLNYCARHADKALEETK